MPNVTKQGEYIAVVKPNEILKGGYTRELEKQVSRLVEEGRNCIVMDLTDIAKMDSTGLGCLLRVCHIAHEAGGGVNLASVQEQVQVMMELVRLNEIMAIYQDKWQAMEDFIYRFETPLAG